MCDVLVSHCLHSSLTLSSRCRRSARVYILIRVAAVNISLCFHLSCTNSEFVCIVTIVLIILCTRL